MGKLIVTFEINADSFPLSVKETIAVDLEKFGNRVRCVSVVQKGDEQMSMDSWNNKST